MSTVRFPAIDKTLGLGVGLDMQWGTPTGLQLLPEECVSPLTTRFLQNYQNDFNYYFFSFQPKNRSLAKPEDYFPGFDSIVENWPAYSTRALHHTQLNLATLEKRQDKVGLAKFTNALIKRYGFSWVNEDLGLWNIGGKILPYPLPPFLTDAGLTACIENTRAFQELLDVPLVIEFPGFSEGLSVVLGNLNAFSFFRTVAEETASPVTLDTGHLLAYQWMRGRRGAQLLEGLEDLPLDHCFEIHLSGCKIIGERFLDLHHGVLLEEQLLVLDYLLKHCPNVKAVTYEDPKFTQEGHLIPNALAGYQQLKERVSQWKQSPTIWSAPSTMPYTTVANWI